MLRKWWRRFLLLFVAKPKIDLGAEPPPPPSVEAAPPDVAPEIELVSANRKMRRALERARRRRDKLVEPKLDHVEAVAERAAPKTDKPKRKKKAKVEEVIVDDPNDVILADELVAGDGQGDVLFEESELYGEFNFRDSILDQLERYWFYLERMRKNSGETYELYRQLGAVLVPRSVTGANMAYEFLRLTAEEITNYKKQINLSPWFKATRPSWGCIAYGTDPLVEERERKHKIYAPKFVYFTRYTKPPPEVQPMSGGMIYKLTVWWDSPDKMRKWGIPHDIPIFVSDDCKHIVALRRLDTRMVKVAKRGNNFDYHLVPQRAWYYPEEYETWSAQYGLTLDLHLPHLFCTIMREFEQTQFSMARVSVSKGDMCASFGINPRRLAYFFRDRDVIVTVSGQRKRILHYVRPHVREDGTTVKSHFRGAREFSWAGYKVLITIPGLDHIVLSDFNVGVHDEYWMPRGQEKKWIDEKEMGRRLAKVVRGAPIEELVR